MHIPDGILALPVVATGAALAAVGLALTVRQIDDRMLPRVALVTATFFVASLVNVSIGPSSVHLLLSGLMGLLLGWAALPATFVALLLQAVFFGFGGLTTLGVTTLAIAVPGIIAAKMAGPFLARADIAGKGLIGGAVASVATGGSALILLGVLSASDPAYAASAPLIIASYVPLMIAEAVVTGFAITFLARVSPDMLGHRLASA